MFIFIISISIIDDKKIQSINTNFFSGFNEYLMEGNVKLSHNLDDLRYFGIIFIKKK